MIWSIAAQWKMKTNALPMKSSNTERYRSKSLKRGQDEDRILLDWMSVPVPQTMETTKPEMTWRTSIFCLNERSGSVS